MDKHDDTWIVIVLGLVGCGLALMVGTRARCHHRQGNLTSCKSNLKNMGTALEMYSTDWSGRYPTTNSFLLITPNYLKTVPTCPKAGIETYTLTYRSHSLPDAYTMYCYGFNHVDASITTANYPQYTAVQGLIERP
ncbi:MAG: hypothetical protein AB7S38_17975 [Vulcanimicrobiota bacterium]